MLSVFALMMATGQILFKHGADGIPRLSRLSDFPALLTNASILAALVLYAVATAFWVFLLQRIPLSRAYPFAALAFVLVPLLAWMIFGERLGLRYALGAGFIAFGVYLTSLAAE